MKNDDYVRLQEAMDIQSINAELGRLRTMPSRFGPQMPEEIVPSAPQNPQSWRTLCHGSDGLGFSARPNTENPYQRELDNRMHGALFNETTPQRWMPMRKNHLGEWVPAYKETI
jgi:hypothetical protein